MLRGWANKISLNATKTEVLLFRSRKKNIAYKLNLKIDEHNLKLSTHVKYLGVLLDEFLAWNHQFEHLASKLSRASEWCNGKVETLCAVTIT